MIGFLAGAVTLAYVIGALFFLRFWRRTSDRLFLAFALAFLLFALNQFLAYVLDVPNELLNSVYVLRVLGFALILVAIAAKNFSTRRANRGDPGGC
jgi:hypothetical protein